MTLERRPLQSIKWSECLNGAEQEKWLSEETEQQMQTGLGRLLSPRGGEMMQDGGKLTELPFPEG